MDMEDIKNLIMGTSDKHKECEACNGYGNSLNQSSSSCPVCDGTGIVKK